jgi:hypothetical protein
MVSKLSVVLTHAGVLFLFLLKPITGIADPRPEAFPLAPGTSWIYQCDIRTKDRGGAETRKPLTWKMEILETLHRGSITVAVVKGHLEDVHRFAGEQGRQQYLIIAFGERRYYLVEPPQAEPLLARLRKSDADLAREVEGQGQLFLELPLVAGQGFPAERKSGEGGGSPAPGFDSWLVKEREEVRLADVKGDVPRGPVERYRLVYGLNKSERTVEFVPGVGIVAYDYHGYAGVPPDSTDWEGHIRLVEYHRGKGGERRAPAPLFRQ